MFFRTKRSIQKSISVWEKRLSALTPEQAGLDSPSSLQMLLEPTYKAAVDAFEEWEQDFSQVMSMGAPDAHYQQQWLKAVQEHIAYLKSLLAT